VELWCQLAAPGCLYSAFVGILLRVVEVLRVAGRCCWYCWLLL